MRRFHAFISRFIIRKWKKKKRVMYVHTKKHVGYPGSEFAYFPLGFAHKGDQNRIKRNQDRTRRALSNALFTFLLMHPQTQEKSKILSKNNEKTLHI